MFEGKAEERRYSREPAVLRVNYVSLDQFFSEFTANINEGGIFIETDKLVHPIGQVVELDFQIPGADTPIAVTGQVKWIQNNPANGPLGMGIEFKSLDREARELINSIVTALRAARSANQELS